MNEDLAKSWKVYWTQKPLSYPEFIERKNAISNF